MCFEGRGAIGKMQPGDPAGCTKVGAGCLATHSGVDKSRTDYGRSHIGKEL